jgi:hypothetical protein
MRISIGDPAHLPDLLSFLLERPDCIAVRAGAHQIAVSLLGSRRIEESAVELEERLAPWRLRNAGVLVELA